MTEKSAGEDYIKNVVRKLKSPNRVEQFFVPGETLIDGPHTCKIFTGVGGRDIYLFGDYHNGPRGTCKKTSTSILSILKYAFKNKLPDGRFIDFMFERSFMAKKLSVEEADTFVHWSENGSYKPPKYSALLSLIPDERISTIGQIEKEFEVCFAPDKSNCRRVSPYSKATRFHYTDIRQPTTEIKLSRSPSSSSRQFLLDDYERQTYQTGIAGISSFAEEELERLMNADSTEKKATKMWKLSTLEAAVIQFVCRITPEVIEEVTNSLFDGYFESISSDVEELKNYMKVLLRADDWVYEIVEAEVYEQNDQIMTFFVPITIDKVYKQLMKSSEAAGIKKWAKVALKRYTDKVRNIFAKDFLLKKSDLPQNLLERLPEIFRDSSRSGGEKLVSALEVGKHVLPGDKLSGSVVSTISNAVFEYCEEYFLNVDVVTIFDVYTLARIFKPSLEKDGGEVWVYAGATHSENYADFIENYASEGIRKPPDYVGEKFYKSSCSFPTECGEEDNPNKCIRILRTH